MDSVVQSKVVEVTDATWNTEVIEASNTKPVFVDFWAPWCTPCKMVAPILDRLSMSMDNIKFAKLNTDDNVDTAMKYQIMAIPHFIIFYKGQPFYREPGARPEPVLRAMIEEQLAKIKSESE